MKEDFLHYVWQYKKFDFSNLTTVSGEAVSIVNSGQYLQQSGPDFFNAQLVIGNQKWAGNVEIHVKSSDWYLHQHEKDDHYNNVILHVVWEYDTPVFSKDNLIIPTVALQSYITKEVLQQYLTLTTPKSWIFCENQIKAINGFVVNHWLERLFFERLENKAIPIQTLLSETDNDWEAVLFYSLAKNFGLNTNGDLFFQSLKSVPFSVIRKESYELKSLEALFFGLLDLLSEYYEDAYAKDLQNSFAFLRQKYQLRHQSYESVQFFKHRPDNFPTIRLAQLAMLYHQRQNLFAQIITIHSMKDFYHLFDLGVSAYWESHYQFDKVSPPKKKQLSKSFIDLLVINTIVPLQFAYAQSLGKEISESLMQLLQTISPEKNIVIEKFANFGLQSKNAFETQSLLQLKNNYCSKGKCLQCEIGTQLMKE
ncbi:DUF2851 family protein [Flavobacterium mekongense]|uniref:DUF2851 family protein n=1 Tax=Flavobacterium mekongense TaxID=3379707 RepID=UPI00399978E1